MNCLIVDDEVLAQDVLALYISRLEFLTLAGRCKHALEAYTVLNRERVDLMFLDIKMPEMSGLDLIRSLKEPPKVVVTSAYDTFALEAYELDIADYLLKPIRFERFLKAVQKVQRQSAVTSAAHLIPAAAIDEPFYVRSERKLLRIDPAEIRYIESLKNYLAIHSGDQKIMVHAALAHIEEELQGNPHFIQVHRSFMVNTRFVAEVGNSMIRLRDHTELPVGASYRDALIQGLRIFNA